MYKNTDKRYTVPMKNAEASVRMEDCQVTPQMREQCQRVLRGEVTTAELLRHFANQPRGDNMAYSIDPIQDNCYPGTTVLVNKLHIHDEAAPYESGG